MKLFNTLAAWSTAALLASLAPPALSGEGHDHGEAPTPAAGPTLPRFAAVSELFELVGVVDGKRITLYLDRFADNSPVKDATLELELDGKPIPVERHGEGEFDAELEHELEPGIIAVTAAVVAGQDADLLAGELDVHKESGAGQATHEKGWGAYAGWLGGGVLVLGLVGWGALRRERARNDLTGGGA